MSRQTSSNDLRNATIIAFIEKAVDFDAYARIAAEVALSLKQSFEARDTARKQKQALHVMCGWICNINRCDKMFNSYPGLTRPSHLFFSYSNTVMITLTEDI